MTFLEICQMVLEEADRDASDLQDVVLSPGMSPQHRKVILWVKRNYRRRQRRYETWRFHHNSGVFLTTLADGTQDYTVSDVKAVNPVSVMYRKSGETTKTPMIYLTYRQWEEQFNLHISPDGVPNWLVELPSGQFRVEPAPNAVFEILADWYSTTSALVRKDDEPLWDEDYHEILVWETLQDYASDFDMNDELQARINDNLPELKRVFARKYLPKLEAPGRFV